MRTTSHYSTEDSVDCSSFEELGLSLKSEKAIELPVVSRVDFNVAGWFGFRGSIWGRSGEVGVMSLEVCDM
jgi:hypothetical protein